MKEKKLQEDDIKTLVKFARIDLVTKFVLFTMTGVASYFGYIYATKKQEEIKDKVSKIPVFGKMFFRS